MAESLRETLGIAKEYPDLKKIDGTTNVIDEIGRTSLKIASLIHEYTRPSLGGKSVSSLINLILFNGDRLVGRAVETQISGNMKSRIKEYQDLCNDLQKKFERRLVMGIKDEQLGKHNPQ